MDLQATELDPDDLVGYHRNPRTSNLDTIVESLRAHGQYRPIVVNAGTLTGRPNEVLAGNHTLEAARQLGWEKIHAVTVDVDDVTAARIAIADNRTADLGEYDRDLLKDLLASLPDLDGTGFEPEVVETIEPMRKPPARHHIADTKSIKLDPYDFPLTDEQFARLVAAIDRWASETGSVFGFVGQLIEHNRVRLEEVLAA